MLEQMVADGLTFRNCQVAAPLKRVDKVVGPVRRVALPQLSSCGPIEACGNRPANRPWAPPFRNCQVAAPLKRGEAGRPCDGGQGLPQLSSCGPIEASAASWTPRSCPCLPQLSSCGPIEACPCAFCRRQIRRLPQLSSCGPIEARRTGRDFLRRSYPSATVKLRPH